MRAECTVNKSIYSRILHFVCSARVCALLLWTRTHNACERAPKKRSIHTRFVANASNLIGPCCQCNWIWMTNTRTTIKTTNAQRKSWNKHENCNIKAKLLPRFIPALDVAFIVTTIGAGPKTGGGGDPVALAACGKTWEKKVLAEEWKQRKPLKQHSHDIERK